MGFAQAFGDIQNSWPFLLTSFVLAFAGTIVMVKKWRVAKAALHGLSLLALAWINTPLLILALLGVLSAAVSHLTHGIESIADPETILEVHSRYGHLE